MKMTLARMTAAAVSASRAWQAWAVTALMLGLIFINPDNHGLDHLFLIAYKGSMVGLGGLGAFWLHVWLYGHIETLPAEQQVPALYTRTALMCAGMLTIALGT